MKIKKMNLNKSGTVVWVQLSNRSWWPGTIKSPDELPLQYLQDFKKDPLTFVKFFHEDKLHHVSKQDQICPYDSSRKLDFIKKGLCYLKDNFRQKFEKDVGIAEKLTGGNMNIIDEFKKKESSHKKKNYYLHIGFGGTEAKSPIITRVESQQRQGFTNIGEAILYKRSKLPSELPKRTDHVIKILEQKLRLDEPIRSESNYFKCYHCGFTCSRVNVIVWHNKAHLKKVENYDSGIRIPGRRKRKHNLLRNKKRRILPSANHLQSNGHIIPKDNSQEAKQLLLDWDDDEEMKELPNGTEAINGVDESSQEEDYFEPEESDEDDDVYDDNYPPPEPRRERQPMPRQVDINSAFDALLADSSPLHNNTPNHNSNYINNDSDSDCSDWEKYYNKSPTSEVSDNQENEHNDIDSTNNDNTNQNGHYSKDETNNLRKSKLSFENDDVKNEDIPLCSSPLNANSSNYKFKSKKFCKSVVGENEKVEYDLKEKIDTLKETKENISDPLSTVANQSTSKSTGPIHVKTPGDISEDHSSQSSSNSSASSGPAYMLVAVDAHGNNVPMPVLSEGGNHLVAVEASMEDGTTRTLYIDPAHLGPNVDLNNLMLHIDNSGQETVIIPTSNSYGENISPTLIEQSTTDSVVTSSHSKISDESSKSSKLMEETTRKRHSSHASKEEKGEKHRKPKHDSQIKLKEESVNLDKVKCDLKLDQNEELDFDELPDLSFPNIEKYELIREDQIVWAETKGNLWPSYVVKLSLNEGMASIFYINCEQSAPKEVKLNTLSPLTYTNFPKIFESQKDKKIAGLTEAMDMANHFKNMKDLNIIKVTSKEFFNYSIEDQRSLINRMKLIKRGVPLELESSLPSCSMIKSPSSSPSHTEEAKYESCKLADESISENKLSEREKQKFQIALKCRRKENKRFIRFIRSETCLNHLLCITRGELHSQRHEDFMRVRHNPVYFTILNELHNPGLDFFGLNETEQLEESYQIIEDQFLESNLNFLSKKDDQRMYVKLVLFPEAIKHSLRNLLNTPEKNLEDLLETGVSQTPTERKAMRLDFDLI